ncbi:MAG: hypothetical protein JJT93_16445 [Gammaproteobacteria bacterium]|nr:hypothetical protein [Gammaproteobacteria bacterium]
MFTFLQPASESVEKIERRQAPVRNTLKASVTFLAPRAVQEENLRMFDELYDGIRTAHGPHEDLTRLRSLARRAIARFPVPILGPGMLNRHRKFASGAHNICNLFRILIAADERLATGTYENAADALVHAFSHVLGHTPAGARQAIIQTAFDCEFFAPELVLMLEALRYD